MRPRQTNHRALYSGPPPKQQSHARDNADRLARAVASFRTYRAPIWFKCGNWDEIVALATQVVRNYEKRRDSPWRRLRFRFELV